MCPLPDYSCAPGRGQPHSGGGATGRGVGEPERRSDWAERQASAACGGDVSELVGARSARDPRRCERAVPHCEALPGQLRRACLLQRGLLRVGEERYGAFQTRPEPHTAPDLLEAAAIGARAKALKPLDRHDSRRCTTTNAISIE